MDFFIKNVTPQTKKRAKSTDVTTTNKWHSQTIFGKHYQVFATCNTGKRSILKQGASSYVETWTFPQSTPKAQKRSKLLSGKVNGLDEF